MCRRIEPARSRAGTHTIEHAVHAIERVPSPDGFDRLFAHFGQPHASPRHFPPPPRRSGLEAATPIPARNTSRLGRSLSRHGVSARLASPERLDRALADDNSCDENATILV